MAEGRYALIITCDKYDDPVLNKLLKPRKDALMLSSILSQPNIGNFDVKNVINEGAHIVNHEIESFFSERKDSDLTLLYFSGHGIKDKDNHLYLASVNTSVKLLAETSSSAELVTQAMNNSLSERQIFLLDCCFGRNIQNWTVANAGETAITNNQFYRNGRVIIAASDEMHYYIEGGELSSRWNESFSFITDLLINSLQTADADKDNDGKITPDELYNYMYRKVIDRRSNQRPQKWSFATENYLIAKSPSTLKKQNGSKVTATWLIGNRISNPQVQSKHDQHDLLPKESSNPYLNNNLQNNSINTNKNNLQKNQRIFICYSHSDSRWLKKLQTHLAPLSRDFEIDFWDDTKIQIGEDWRDKIKYAIDSARVAILLISPHFLASNFISNNELPPILTAAKEKGKIILSLNTSYSIIHEYEEIMRYQMVNKPSAPLASLSTANQDKILSQMTSDIKSYFDN